MSPSEFAAVLRKNNGLIQTELAALRDERDTLAKRNELAARQISEAVNPVSTMADAIAQGVARALAALQEKKPGKGEDDVF